MKWKDILTQKRSESLTLVSVIMLVVMIGYVNRSNVSELKGTVTSIYEDRLVAKDYIFEVSKKIHEKKSLIDHEEELVEISTRVNESVRQLINSYEQTELTVEESVLLEKLKDDVRLSEQFENQFLYNPAQPQREVIEHHLKEQYDVVLSDLYGLSEIQLHEGKKLLDDSHQVMASNVITSRLLIALLVVAALVVIITNSPVKKEFSSPEAS